MNLYNIGVFLDRDGVLIEESRSQGAYLLHPEQVRLLPGAAAAVRRLNDARLLVIVVTNQAAIARGFITEEGLNQIHARLCELLRADAGAWLDKIYYCPYHPEGIVPRYAHTSECRKPAPGMLLEAARELHLDLRHCCLVGDQESDIIAAKKVSCTGVAVQTQPYGINCPGWVEGRPDFIASDLTGAVDWILETLRQNGRSQF